MEQRKHIVIQHKKKMGTEDYWQVMGSFKCSDSDVT